MARSKKKDTTIDDRSQDVGESIEDLGSAAADLGHEAQEQVSNLTDQVRQQATTQLGSQKEQLVDTLETVALLLHQAGENAQQQEKTLLASYVDKAARKVSTLSESLGEQEVTEVVQSTRDFARREPMLFVGGALAAGFLGARFLRSSSEQATQSGQEQSGNGANSSATTGDLSTGLPAYDMDQTSSASSEDYLGATSPTPGDAMVADNLDFLDDYQSSVTENDVMGDDVDATVLPDLDDVEQPENL